MEEYANSNNMSQPDINNPLFDMNSNQFNQENNNQFNQEMNNNLEDMMPQFMNCFSQLEKDPEFSGMMQNMMHQFMSKDVILEPMKILYDAMPEWLERKKNELDIDT